jgi:hypothetical protein
VIDDCEDGGKFIGTALVGTGESKVRESAYVDRSSATVAVMRDAFIAVCTEPYWQTISVYEVQEEVAQGVTPRERVGVGSNTENSVPLNVREIPPARARLTEPMYDSTGAL